MTEPRSGPGRRAFLAGMCLSGLLVSCGGGERPARPPANAERRPNVIFLTVDTLRADHLRLYGYSRDTMPEIGAFARTAAVFDNAVATRGSTRPSYTSMLTGLYPYHHGVRSNAAVLNEDATTLPELLKAAGYRTAAFVSNFVLVSELSGLAQGFDVYDDRMEDRESSRPNYERRADHTRDAILEWLDSGPPEPFFLFTNFVDPHGPYDPPERLRDLFRSRESRILRPDQIPPYQQVEGQYDFYDYLDRYDAEIRYADEAIGSVIEALKERGLWDDSLVVFTADHGEAMGEHTMFFEHHWHVWEETTRVPLAIRLPGRQAGSRVEQVASPMDLAPTVLDLLGLGGGAGMDGVSLLPAMGGKQDPHRVVFVEFPNEATPKHDHPEAFAVRGRTHSLVREIYPGKAGPSTVNVFFNLLRDPYEQDPVPLNPGGDADQALLFGAMDRFLDGERTYVTPYTVTVYEVPVRERETYLRSRRNGSRHDVKPLTEEQIEKLRSLGYVQ